MDSEEIINNLVQPIEETSFTEINSGLKKPDTGRWIDIFTGSIKEALLKMKGKSNGE